MVPKKSLKFLNLYKRCLKVGNKKYKVLNSVQVFFFCTDTFCSILLDTFLRDFETSDFCSTPD